MGYMNNVGGEDGQDLEDWFKAERRIVSQGAQTAEVCSTRLLSPGMP
jgi:hypothetical protein